MPCAYYNEIDPYCVAWLRNLIAAGLIAAGDVDSRPIQEVQSDDLRRYIQCHFFAGIAGWSLAARLAGWPDDRAIWTGSCPCQPFSVAGRRKGIADKRHLWPHFHRLIRASRPALIMGEQVASAPGYAWLTGVEADLEAEAYSCRAVDIPACSVGAPQIRNRLYWVACPHSAGRPQQRGAGAVEAPRSIAECGGSDPGGMGGTDYSERRPAEPRGNDDHGTATGRDEGDGDAQGSGGAVGGMGGTDNAGRRGNWNQGTINGQATGFWDQYVLAGPDPQGKYRRVKPGIALLDSGIPCRVAKLRALGNAICPPLAAEVIRAWMEVYAT